MHEMHLNLEMLYTGLFIIKLMRIIVVNKSVTLCDTHNKQT